MKSPDQALDEKFDPYGIAKCGNVLFFFRVKYPS